MSGDDLRHERARSAFSEIRHLLAGSPLAEARGVEPSLLDSLTEDLPRELPPVYREYLLAFGEYFELMQRFGYSFTLETVSFWHDFSGDRFAYIGTHRDVEIGHDTLIGYDLGFPSLEGLDCRVMIRQLEEDSTPMFHFNSLLELVRQCAFGHARFGDDLYWGGADVTVVSQPSEADDVWRAIHGFASKRSMHSLQPSSRWNSCFDGPGIWMEAGSCSHLNRVVLRLGGVDPHDVSVAWEQLLDGLASQVPGCRIE